MNDETKYSTEGLVEEMARNVVERYLTTGVPPAVSIAKNLQKEGLEGKQDTLIEDVVTMRTHQIIAERVLRGNKGLNGKPGLIGYKVVYNMFVSQPYLLSKPLRPVTADAFHWIDYAWGEITKPVDSGPFAVFKYRESAERWVRAESDRTHLHIYLVRYEFSNGDALWRKLSPGERRGQYGRHYIRAGGVLERKLDECAPGTALADTVELTADLTPYGVVPELLEKARDVL